MRYLLLRENYSAFDCLLLSLPHRDKSTFRAIISRQSSQKPAIFSATVALGILNIHT